MSYVRGWHAWYADGSEYSSTTHVPTQLPQVGFQLMMIYFTDMTRRVMAGNDTFFFYDNGSADGVWGQTDDPATDVAARYPGSRIISGSLLSDVDYRAIEVTAHRRKEP